MVTETERAWLAGIWDGEGSISLFQNTEKDGAIKLKPIVNMVNTDMGIINKCLDIIERGGCHAYIVNRRHSVKNPKHKDVVEIKFSSVPNIKGILELIEPYLEGSKKSKAQILLRYVNRRSEKFLRGDRSYEEEDFEDMRLIRSSETTCETPTFNSNVW